ncbi:MAG TPA: Uma2 family endonuclease [Pirellulales bacterium]|nr:Uma2 family endonuclease [Pirellulales bacterium]
MLRKANSPTGWMKLFDVPPKSGERIASEFGAERLRYDPDTETLALPSRMRGVTWEQYDTLLKALPDHRLRHTYDRGFLEIMPPSQKHDKLKRVIGGFIEQMALSLGILFEPFGSATYRRRSAESGLEPDETYYIANASAMQGKFDYNPRRDPPPDLVVEVDLRRPSSRRMRIYAALRVPEVWKYDGQAMRFFALGAKGKYEEVEQSLSFPFVAPADLDRFLARLASEPSNDVFHAFTKWAKAEHRKLVARKPRKKKGP